MPSLRAPLARALAVALALVALPPPTHAQPAQDEPPEVIRARELYDDGQAAFETADYDRAIRLWSEAYAEVPRTETYRAVRADLIYNIASARIEAYLDDHDLEHLRKAERLLLQYLEEYPELRGAPRPADEETRKVERRLDEVRHELQRAERGEGPESAPTPVDTPNGVAPTDEVSPRASGMTIGGGVLVGLGAAAAVTSVVGIALSKKALDDFESGEFDRDAVRQRGRQATALAIGAGVTAGVLVAAGVALLVVGRRRDKARRLAVGGGGAASALEIRF